MSATAAELAGHHPAGEILARLERLYPKLIDLSLDRITRLLAALGHPERRLPPVIHVAGTNGKGSTCAFLRAIAEHAGLSAHVTTSPHLVRLNERFRVAGELVSDEALAEALLEVERANAGAPITVFEVLVAAGFVLFAGTPADIAIVEVGLGGRFDATNVIAAPAVCAITSISFDHMDFLGDTLEMIAREKAGIIKPGRPVVTGAQAPDAAAVLRREAARLGAPLHERGRHWDIAERGPTLRFTDDAGSLTLPRPSLPGPHQIENAGIAVAAWRAAGIAAPDAALDAAPQGIANATWPARLQRLHGRLRALLPPGFELWLDGGHNEGAGHALAATLATWRDRPISLIVGMKQGKEAAAFLAPLLPHAAAIWAVREPGQHLGMEIADIIAASLGRAVPGPDLAGALRQAGEQQAGRVLTCGSLYLAGVALAADSSDPLP